MEQNKVKDNFRSGISLSIIRFQANQLTRTQHSLRPRYETPSGTYPLFNRRPIQQNNVKCKSWSGVDLSVKRVCKISLQGLNTH